MDDIISNSRMLDLSAQEPATHIEQSRTSIKTKRLSSENNVFFDEVTCGLNQQQKTLPCKYFYDEKGSKLFEDICSLPEYYVTRTELALLENIKDELAIMIGKNATIIEPGAGAGIKIRTLLQALNSPELYVPLDISRDFLFYSAEVIQKKFPDIDIMPIQGDFTNPVKWLGKKESSNRIVFFPGSTIGNFKNNQAVSFLSNMHQLIGENGAMIIGVDLLKEQTILESAYDDAEGVTAAFNKNLLSRINHELNADFNLNLFEHEAFLNHQKSRIEMHLVSTKNQTVNINGEKFIFSANETIHTENSHKYSIESFLKLASQAKLKKVKTWSDENNYFSIHYLVRV